MQIIKYSAYNDILVRFDDGYEVKNIYWNFKLGNIQNPYDKTVYGKGYLGEGNYKNKINGKKTRQYNTWHDMLRRCYDEEHRIKNPTYIDCSVCDEWLNYQNFAEWYDENYYDIDNQIMHIEKDIIHKGNKIYSPENCVFVPAFINSLFTRNDINRGNLPIGVYWSNKKKKYISQCSEGNGIQAFLGDYNNPIDAFNTYKIHKEQLIKSIANENINKIPKRLYNAMINYQVEITD